MYSFPLSFHQWHHHLHLPGFAAHDSRLPAEVPTLQPLGFVQWPKCWVSSGDSIHNVYAYIYIIVYKYIVVFFWGVVCVWHARRQTHRDIYIYTCISIHGTYEIMPPNLYSWTPSVQNRGSTLRSPTATVLRTDLRVFVRWHDPTSVSLGEWFGFSITWGIFCQEIGFGVHFGWKPGAKTWLVSPKWTYSTTKWAVNNIFGA